MKRVVLFSGILTVAAVIAAILVFPNSASTQTLPAPSSVRIVETTYTPAGVSTIGGNGSVAWFIETNSQERRPVACVSVSGSVECKRGTFPQP